MSLALTVAAGKRFTNDELVDNAKLNQLAVPTVTLSGSADTTQIGNDAVTAAKAAFGAWFKADESGTANAHVLTASGHSIVAYATGMVVRYYPQNDNTGAVTANLNGVGARPVRKPGSASGLELQAGDLRQGQMIQLCFDMAHDQWWLQSPLANAAWDRYAETLSATANQYTATFSPTITDLVTGLRVVVKWNSTNTSTAQFNPDGKGLKAIRKAGDVALVAGDIVDNQVSQLVYDADANASAGAWILTGPTTPTTRTTVPVRQCILSCSLDGTTGLPNFLTYSGTTVSFQNCDTTNLVIAFAYGQDSSGAVDYVGTVSANASAWTGLNGVSSTYYLYVDRDVTTGALAYGKTTTRPIYTNVPGTGNNTYIIPQGKMVDGSSTAIQRVFVGEATTSGASVVNSVTGYMPQGRFQSSADQTAARAAGAFTETHQLGVVPRVVRWVLYKHQTAELGYSVGDEVDVFSLLWTPGSSYGWPPSVFANATTCGLRKDWSGGAAPYIMNGSGVATLIPNDVTNLLNWKVRCYASRGW